MRAKIINLRSRTDRRQECLDEIKAISSSLVEFDFFDAVEDAIGARGCSLSHAKIISEFLTDGTDNHLIVLEDDFSVRDPASFDERIKNALATEAFWDVFLLGHNLAIPIEKYANFDFCRVINAHTTSGYIVSKRFAPELFSVFQLSAFMFKQYAHLYPHSISQFALDVLWKFHQVKHRFLTTIPSTLVQRPSYSDIIKQEVDYRA